MSWVAVWHTQLGKVGTAGNTSEASATLDLKSIDEKGEHYQYQKSEGQDEDMSSQQKADGTGWPHQDP